MMSRSIALLSAGLWLAWAPAAGAQTQMLDLVPGDAAAALVVRNLDELKAKGDKLIAESELKVPLRPSELFAMGLQFLGANAGIDSKSSAAIIIAGPEPGQQVTNLDSLVVALPFTDLDKIAGNFDFLAGELKPNKMGTRNRNNLGKFFYARGKHLFLGNSEKAVTRVAHGKSVGLELPEAQRNSVNRADMLLHIGVKAWGREWHNFLNMLKDTLGKRTEAGEQKVVDEFAECLAHMRFGLGAVRIDGGVGLSFLTVFSKDDKEVSQKFLAALRGGPGSSNLKGLPAGTLLAAQALHGDGSKNAIIAKVFFDFLLKNFLETKQVLAAVDRPVVVGFLTEVWHRLKGSRAGLYLTGSEQKLGLFSLLAILDTDDAEQFLADMRMLARFADGTGLDLGDKKGARDQVEVEQLIKDLGAARFRARELATLKLRLLGQPALPYLEKARSAPDLEVARRAQRLSSEISAAAVLRRKELLSKDLLRHVRPTFAFVPRAEKRQGHRIDVVRIQLAERDQPTADSLQQLFGPQWHNLRLAVHGKHVVVFLGSDVKLLEETLKNLDQGKAGLAEAKIVKDFQEGTKAGRKIEFHVSMEKILALIGARRPAGPGKKGSSLTSFGLSVETNFLQLDVWVPSAEIKVIAQKNSWFF